MTRLFLAALLVAWTSAVGAQSPPNASSAAILDGATHLWMLTERIAKLHAQLGQEILVLRSRRSLTEALGEFDRAAREMPGQAPTAEIRESYLLLKNLSQEYRTAAALAPTPESARKLADRNDEVAWVAAKGARLLQEHDRTLTGERLLAAGTIRAVAQRIAKLHLQRGWAMPQSAFAKELRVADAQYHLAMATLQGAAETNAAIASELRLAGDQFAFLNQAVARLSQGKARALQLEHIAKTADVIVEVMDRVVRQLIGD